MLTLCVTALLVSVAAYRFHSDLDDVKFWIDLDFCPVFSIALLHDRCRVPLEYYRTPECPTIYLTPHAMSIANPNTGWIYVLVTMHDTDGGTITDMFTISGQQITHAALRPAVAMSVIVSAYDFYSSTTWGSIQCLEHVPLPSFECCGILA